MRRALLTLIVLASLLPLLGAGSAAAFAGPSGNVPAIEHGEDHAPAEASGEQAKAHGGHLGEELSLLWVLPFAGILLSIAVLPLAVPHFWHEHYPKVSFAWAALLAVPFLFFFGHEAWHAIIHIYLIDYIPFIILLWGLFTVAGGIVVRGSLRGTPALNTLLLLIGTLMASWVGTTGAAMVMIRPVLRANADRKNKVHVIVFFIFLVANIGGSLTPLGDPPLFLGFLHGVPFFWTTTAMLLPMGLAAGILLVVFYLLDRRFYVREGGLPEHEGETVPFQIAGWHNFFFLGGIVGAVLMSGIWESGAFTVLGTELRYADLARDLIIVLMGMLSLRTTRFALRRENEFGWGPIAEVAYLFAGIFMTIVPALEILKAGESGALAHLIRAVEHPWQYYWITGGLSSFLDNAPTYLTFFNLQLGRFFPGVPESEAVHHLIAEYHTYLLAVASGAVFMGANTYIGNAPNFMVKSIAEEAGISMPSFFGYILKWSLPILIPVFVVVTLVFFRG